jgi:hypothetical protein
MISSMTGAARHRIAWYSNSLGIDPDWLYYLAGRFPEDVRDKKLSEKQVAEAMVAFRGGLRGGPRKGKGRS